MADMLVNLLELPDYGPDVKRLEEQGISIARALAPDKMRVVEWVQQHSSLSAAGECDVCFARVPVSCFVALRDKEILGYACYNAIAPDFFGPTRVLDSCQGLGIGRALLLRSLAALRDEGYVYAIIGGIGPREFYEKCVGAVMIENSTPGIYRHYIGARPKKETANI